MTTMLRSELFKLRHHRTPWVLAGSACLLMLIIPVYTLIRPPAAPVSYFSDLPGLYQLAAMMLGAVFGSWLIGHEYRQGTLRRVVAIDANRGRLLVAKAATGLASMLAALVAIAGVGLLAAAAAASLNGDAIVMDGVLRSTVSGAFVAIVTAAIGYLASIVLRSDTYAMLTALALMVVFGPIAGAIPRIGDYTPYALAESVAAWIRAEPGTLAVGTAAASLTAIMAVLTIGATTVFGRRDI